MRQKTIAGLGDMDMNGPVLCSLVQAFLFLFLSTNFCATLPMTQKIMPDSRLVGKYKISLKTPFE